MKHLTLPLTAILITTISFTSCNSSSWSSSDKEACINEILNDPELGLTSEDMEGYEESLNAIAECMCDVLESEFSSFKEASNNIDNDEWAIENPDAALELAGCIFSGFSESEMEELLDETFEDIDEEHENLEEELEEALEEFEDALEDIEF